MEPSLPELQNYICRVATKWYVIGTQLKIPPHDLSCIGNGQEDPTVVATKVILAWQRNTRPPFFWATFIDVLTRECVGEYALAKEIASDVLKKLLSY